MSYQWNPSNLCINLKNELVLAVAFDRAMKNIVRNHDVKPHTVVRVDIAPETLDIQTRGGEHLVVLRSTCRWKCISRER